MKKKYQSFSEFYPHYLDQHQKTGTRICHFLGLTGAFICLGAFITNYEMKFILLGFVCGYGPAVLSHFVFEKNIPATRHNPFYSILGDFKMCFDLLTGKEKF